MFSMKSEMLKDHAGTIYTVVEAVILGVSVCMLAWTSAKLIAVGETVSMHGNQIVDLSKRTEKLETATLLSATMPGKLDTMNVRLDAIIENQRRIELMIVEHMKIK